MKSPNVLTAVLLQPQSVASFQPADWDVLLRQGRRANLLGRLAKGLQAAGLFDSVPLAPRLHLESAVRITDRQSTAVHHEVECIRLALADIGARPILLKGAAYLMAGLPAAAGRAFSDIDILVPKAQIAEAESALVIHGWTGADATPYDQRYYRRWMHEIPPMQHMRRGTTIDLHHAILPLSARIKVNTDALFERTVELPGHPGVLVLQPLDMLLHSATHLFHEGEMENGLRDLFDLDSLLRHFGKQTGFWPALVPRAVELGLARPLYYALKFTGAILGTPVSTEVIAAARAGQPPAAVDRIMELCYLRAFKPIHITTDTVSSRPARIALYVRSHWIRMPVHLLALHLGRKALIRPKPPADEGAAKHDEKAPFPAEGKLPQR